MTLIPLLFSPFKMNFIIRKFLKIASGVFSKYPEEVCLEKDVQQITCFGPKRDTKKKCEVPEGEGAECCPFIKGLSEVER